MHRFHTSGEGDVIFMLHGSIENGRIFFSNSGKGLAPYLAAQGFDVYVADLRGRGESKPTIGRDSDYGLTESITQEIPLFLEKIVELRGMTPQHWIAHSWGGVLLASYFARYEKYRGLLKSQVYFGTKRRVTVNNIKKIFLLDIIWNFLGRILVSLYGYLPAKKWHIGSDNETRKSFYQTKKWVEPSPWQDEDGFDYATAMQKLSIPPTLCVIGAKDMVLGHQQDVALFNQEMGEEQTSVLYLAMSNGFLHDYDHINMLTHRDAPRDHFPRIVKWLQNSSNT
jgi:alpha-beta hydrolase superfamily lysophospholipase